MLVNILFGFLIPWIFGIYLYKKNPAIVLTLAPFAAVVSYTLDTFGREYGFWRFTPFSDKQSLLHLPIHIGFFPVAASYLYHYIDKKPDKWIKYIMMFTISITVVEYFVVLSGKLAYRKGWNIFYTGIVYLLVFLLGYGYYKILNKKIAANKP